MFFFNLLMMFIISILSIAGLCGSGYLFLVFIILLFNLDKRIKNGK